RGSRRSVSAGHGSASVSTRHGRRVWARSARFARAGSRGDTHTAIGGGYGVRPGRLGGRRARPRRMRGANDDGRRGAPIEGRGGSAPGGGRGHKGGAAGGPPRPAGRPAPRPRAGAGGGRRGGARAA